LAAPEVRVGWGVSEVLEAFVASLPTTSGHHDDPAYNPKFAF
jgi:hypothetical protein